MVFLREFNCGSFLKISFLCHKLKDKDKNYLSFSQQVDYISINVTSTLDISICEMKFLPVFLFAGTILLSYESVLLEDNLRLKLQAYQNAIFYKVDGF